MMTAWARSVVWKEWGSTREESVGSKVTVGPMAEPGW